MERSFNSEIEFNNGHIEGALNIPVDNLRERLDELDKDKEIIEYCQVGLRGYVASSILSQKGYRVKNITGGYKSASSLNFTTTSAKDTNERQIIDQDTQVIKSEVAIDSSEIKYDKFLDACGLCCPGPLMQVKAATDELSDGQILKVTASDPGFYMDIKAWCQRTNNELQIGRASCRERV